VRLVRLLHLDDAEHDDPETCPDVEVLPLLVAQAGTSPVSNYYIK